MRCGKKECCVQATVWDLYGKQCQYEKYHELVHFFRNLCSDSYRASEALSATEAEAPSPSTSVSLLTALGRSLSSIEIAPLWAEMVDVSWPRDPLHRIEPEEDYKLKLEWKMLWCADNKQVTRVNCIACNPQDRVGPTT